MGEARSTGRVSAVVESDRRALRQARLLDLRSYLAGLFLIFGVVVTLAGLTATPAQLVKSSGMNLSLWTGLALILLGLVFLVWLVRVPPLFEQSADQDPESQPEGD